MRTYIIKRVLQSIPILFGISLIVFAIIQLPPGDYLTTYVNNLRSQGEVIGTEELDALKAQYGLDEPVTVQYVKWITNFVQGDMGFSFYWNKPVRDLIGERILLSMIVSIFSLILTYLIAIPVGLFSATRPYSLADNILTILAFLGVGLPTFLVALVIMYAGLHYLGLSAGGLFAPEFLDAPWSMARVVDLLKHVWLPALVVGVSGTAGTIRDHARHYPGRAQPALCRGGPRARAA